MFVNYCLAPATSSFSSNLQSFESHINQLHIRYSIIFTVIKKRNTTLAASLASWKLHFIRNIGPIILKISNINFLNDMYTRWSTTIYSGVTIIKTSITQYEITFEIIRTYFNKSTARRLWFLGSWNTEIIDQDSLSCKRSQLSELNNLPSRISIRRDQYKFRWNDTTWRHCEGFSFSLRFLEYASRRKHCYNFEVLFGRPWRTG